MTQRFAGCTGRCRSAGPDESAGLVLSRNRGWGAGITPRQPERPPAFPLVPLTQDELERKVRVDHRSTLFVGPPNDVVGGHDDDISLRTGFAVLAVPVDELVRG